MQFPKKLSNTFQITISVLGSESDEPQESRPPIQCSVLTHRFWVHMDVTVSPILTNKLSLPFIISSDQYGIFYTIAKRSYQYFM